jgi:hypothetical protein
MGASYPGDVTPSGTRWPNGIVWEDSFAAIWWRMNLENVEQITVVSTVPIMVQVLFLWMILILVGQVPEPATMLLLLVFRCDWHPSSQIMDYSY